jgi:hypothetical protein
VERPRAPSFAVFAVLSLSVHGAAFVVAGRRANVPVDPAFEPLSPPLTGDTLEVQPESPSETTDDSPAPISTTVARHAPPPGTNVRRDWPGHETGSTSGPVAPPPMFGAVGVRSATDLATTFTRALPQAASADALWSSAPFGSAGVAEVTLVLDDEGRLASHEIRGPASSALRQGIDRTLVLLAARPFTARGATTKLRVAARVSRDDIHDGLHGDVFALSGGSFLGEIGSAFFTLPAGVGPGRRVDVEVRLSR